MLWSGRVLQCRLPSLIMDVLILEVIQVAHQKGLEVNKFPERDLTAIVNIQEVKDLMSISRKLSGFACLQELLTSDTAVVVRINGLECFLERAKLPKCPLQEIEDMFATHCIIIEFI